jgi:hypothetical protein
MGQLMNDLDPLNFSNRDLRNRSFRGKNLNGVDFSGADIRGCDFSYSRLVGANFERARAGQTSRQVLPPLLIAGILALVSANGVARLIFASLGQTPAQASWFSVMMLHIFSGVSGIGSASRVLLGLDSRVGKVAMYLSGICSGALMTFFYAGSYSGNNSQTAIAGAIVGAGFVAILNLIVRRPMAILVLAMGAVAAYGFSFLIWTVASACFSTERYEWGICSGALSLVYVWFVICSLRTIGHEISQLIGTSFQGADITNTQFDQADLKNTDFSRVIGHPR